MTDPVDVFAQVKTTMTEILGKMPDDSDSAVAAVCLGVAQRLAAKETRADLKEFWAERFYQAADELAAPRQTSDPP